VRTRYAQFSNPRYAAAVRSKAGGRMKSGSQQIGLTLIWLSER